jgi:hypothetical protein
MDDIQQKLRAVEAGAAELIRLADSIDAGVYLTPQKAAIEGMQNMLRRWQRWELRESLIAFGLAECRLPCPQKRINEALEEMVNA